MNKKLFQVLHKIVASELEQVFVYETLMNNKLRSRLLKRPTETVVDQLIGYREISTETIEGKNYHTIIPDDASAVMGRRFYVTQEELRKLDRWEDEYHRKKVQLLSGNRAWIYFLKVSSMKDMGHNIYAES